MTGMVAELSLVAVTIASDGCKPLLLAEMLASVGTPPSSSVWVNENRAECESEDRGWIGLMGVLPNVGDKPSLRRRS